MLFVLINGVLLSILMFVTNKINGVLLSILMFVTNKMIKLK